MKKLLLFLVLLMSTSLLAQNDWAPIGAKWYFNRPHSTMYDYVVIESIKDSTIKGKNVRVLDVKINNTKPVSHEYIHQKGDSIFYYNRNHGSFNLLYNFAAKTGDTITVHNRKFKATEAFFYILQDSVPYFKYKVTAVDSIQSAGRWIKRQKVAALKPGIWGFVDARAPDYYVLDGIGGLTYFFGVSGNIILEEVSVILRCYTGPGYEFRNPEWTEDCDLITAVNEIRHDDEMVIYPNPCTNQLHVNLPDPFEIEIIDINGSRVSSTHHQGGPFVINTSLLSDGCYLLRIITRNHVFSKKLIKRS